MPLIDLPTFLSAVSFAAPMSRIHQIPTSQRSAWMLWCVWAQAASGSPGEERSQRVRSRSPAAAFEAFGHSRSRIPGAVGPGDKPASSRRSLLPASPFGSGRAQRLVHPGAAVLIRQPGIIQIGLGSMNALDSRIDEAR